MFASLFKRLKSITGSNTHTDHDLPRTAASRINLADLACLLMQHADIPTCIALAGVCTVFRKIIRPVLSRTTSTTPDDCFKTTIKKMNDPSSTLELVIFYHEIPIRTLVGHHIFAAKDSIKSKINIMNGNYHGLYQGWHQCGPMECECTYMNGEKEGLSSSWYENGALRRSCNYKNGKKHGVLRKWYPRSGWINPILLEAHYVEGKLHGSYKRWNPNGKLEIETNYQDGLKSGIDRFWSTKGNLQSEAHYVNGTLHGEMRSWSPSDTGLLIYSSYYIDGVETNRQIGPN